MVDIELEVNPDFLKEEWRSDHFVSAKTKEIWAVQIDLLMKLDKVCKLHGLNYCVGAGTLLGAVRHGGYIPWDDDIDVYMLREDYDQLMSLADEFQDPYFLQSSLTEKNLLRTYSRLRNGNTTGTTKVDSLRDINKGLFIDIFPLDGVSDNRIIDRIQTIKNFFMVRVYNCYNAAKLDSGKNSGKIGKKLRFQALLGKLFVPSKMLAYRIYEANIKRCSASGTKMWGNRTIRFDCPKSRRPLEDYRDLIYLPFEFVEVPAPRNYDSILRQQYGDYMKIPKNKGQNMHGELIISTNYSYDDPRRLDEK